MSFESKKTKTACLLEGVKGQYTTVCTKSYLPQTFEFISGGDGWLRSRT